VPRKTTHGVACCCTPTNGVPPLLIECPQTGKNCAFPGDGQTIYPTVRSMRTVNAVVFRVMMGGPPTETHIYNARASVKPEGVVG
jgi:hypothetical protein